MARQVLIVCILCVLSLNKIAESGVLFYFFSDRPTNEIVYTAVNIQKKCNIKVIGVVKGVLEGERLIDAVKRLNKYQKDGFEVWIDPTLYDLFQIEAVPCFVLVPNSFAYSRMCVGNEKIKAKKICGNLSIKYVLRRFRACKK